MAPVVRLLARVAVLVALVVTPLVPPQSEAAASEGETPVVSSEVRLRKLHLVRPDLIPYPIAYEVCC